MFINGIVIIISKAAHQFTPLQRYQNSEFLVGCGIQVGYFGRLLQKLLLWAIQGFFIRSLKSEADMCYNGQWSLTQLINHLQSPQLISVAIVVSYKY